jgi:hypothetical protein
MAGLAKTPKRPSDGLRSFAGSVATTGNSRGLRLEKAFFQAAPEFGTTGSPIRADLIGPGTILIRMDVPSPAMDEHDPVIGAWLSFIDADVQANPGRLVPLKKADLAGLEKLVEGVVVSDEDVIPDDVTF